MEKYKIVNERRFNIFLVVLFILAVLAISFTWMPIIRWYVELTLSFC